MQHWKAACVFFWALVLSLAADAQLGIGGPILGSTPVNWASPGPIGSTTPSTGAFTTLSGTTITASTQYNSANGTAGAPGLCFNSDCAENTGWYRRAIHAWTFSNQGTGAFEFNTTQFTMTSGATINWLSGAISTSADLVLARDGADILAQKRTTNAQNRRLYFSTTGPIYWQETARTAGAAYTATGGAAQVSYIQTTAPTCSSNCGTSPSVVGTDVAGIVTMGASGAPTSGFVITFNGTWPAAPSCNVQSALTSMVVGKMPINYQSTTTTITVTTNGTAPGNSDKYSYQCFGVS